MKNFIEIRDKEDVNHLINISNIAEVNRLYEMNIDEVEITLNVTDANGNQVIVNTNETYDQVKEKIVAAQN